MPRATAMLTVAAATILGASGADAQTTARAEARTTAEADVVVVRMLDKSATRYVFEPSRITVTPGQTIRFVQEGDVPHNVEFKDAPAGARIDDVQMGPFLTRKGEAYEVRIDGRFSGGSYDYVCTPHVAMGMKGTIVVEESVAAREGK